MAESLRRATLDLDWVHFAQRLEMHHELFRALWEIGAPVPTEDLPTAAVTFNAKGEPLHFLLNPTFWASLPEYEREFLVCHEMLHAVLNHGFRSRGWDYPALANIAADVVVNQLLVDRFGFTRELLRDWQSLCWVDTVFPEGTTFGNELTMENVYARLIESNPGELPLLLDIHLFGGNLQNPRAAAEMDSLLRDRYGHLAEELKEEFGSEGMAPSRRGTGAVGAWCAVSPTSVRRVPWESIVRRRLRPAMHEDIGEGWVLPARRFDPSEGLVVPGHGLFRRPVNRKGRQRCVFFLDASGSTVGLWDRFFAVCQSIPSADYDIDLCSFDTTVYPLDRKKPVVRGGGGTSFTALEQWLTIWSSKPYPDVVFVLTDGYGDVVKPRYPERWHWLLTTDFDRQLPKSSVIVKLKDYR